MEAKDLKVVRLTFDEFKALNRIKEQNFDSKGYWRGTMVYLYMAFVFLSLWPLCNQLR